MKPKVYITGARRDAAPQGAARSEGPCGSEAGARIERAASDHGYTEEGFAALLRAYRAAAPEAVEMGRYRHVVALASDYAQARLWNAAASAERAAACALYAELFGPPELVRVGGGRSVRNPAAEARRRAADAAFQAGRAAGLGQIAEVHAYREGEATGRAEERLARHRARSGKARAGLAGHFATALPLL